jgi:hypothetical protein
MPRGDFEFFSSICVVIYIRNTEQFTPSRQRQRGVKNFALGTYSYFKLLKSSWWE